MRKIDPNAIYESQELKEILRGFVKIETLREFGLDGSPGSGYWGRNVVDSLDKYWDHRARQRGTGKVIEKENCLDEKPAFFENRENQVQNQPVYPASGKNQPMES